ncbi:MAG: hypothetical protein ACKOZX_08305, partial [Gammaproteobacteria bacterium]
VQSGCWEHNCTVPACLLTRLAFNRNLELSNDVVNPVDVPTKVAVAFLESIVTVPVNAVFFEHPSECGFAATV